MIYTAKQAELLRVFKENRLCRLNILHGSVRSGKTWISLVLWAFWVADSPKDKSYLMVAKTLTSLKRNCLDLLESLIGKNNFQYSLSMKQAWLFGRKIYLEGVSDARAESKIRGMTLQGAYCDELTLFTEDFFAMLLSRLSENGAKLFGTTNPDSPNHWLKKNYMDRQKELDMFIMQFLIDDNTTLPPEYIGQIKAEYSGGVFYRRFILGEWVVAEGLIYPQLANGAEQYMIERKDLPRVHTATIGEDFGGNKSRHAVVCSAIGTDGKLYFTKARCKNAPGTTAEDLVLWSTGFFAECAEDLGQNVDIYADSAEQVLINTISARTRYNVYNSIKKPIIDRIRALTILLSTDRVRFVRGECDELIKALSEAVWSDKKDNERLDDGTFNNDIIDAAEYSFEYNMNWLVKI